MISYWTIGKMLAKILKNEIVYKNIFFYWFSTAKKINFIDIDFTIFIKLGVFFL